MARRFARRGPSGACYQRNMRTRASIAVHGSRVPQHRARSFGTEIPFSGDLLSADTFARSMKHRVVRLNSTFAAGRIEEANLR